ncbi:hypothetical protein B566_EDAN017791 [Ephemera danica]|nr:hypothetical protein B566_EDAN017791 [Ephemera danica]
MILSLKQNEADFDKMSDESSDLVQISGETRISVNVQQITSRFQSIQSTAKAVTDHQAYLEKFKQASAWLANAQSRYAKCCDARGSRQEVEGQQVVLRELLGEQGTAAQLVNTTVELGEKLYPSTAADGREAVRMQLEELQQALEALLDDVSATDKKLHDKISRVLKYKPGFGLLI